MRLRREVSRAVTAALLVLAAGCAPAERRPYAIRDANGDFAFSVTAEPLPPYAREATLYKVVIRHVKTKEPIEAGEGRIFATSADGASTWDSFTKGQELGTYYGKLNFITAGEWAMALQFRRDSTESLVRIDWRQVVLPER
jgi:hypothetical protein